MIKFLSDSIAKKYRGKACLLRIDLNIEAGAPLDSYRLEAVLPTIKLLLKNKTKVVILSHRGRPNGSQEKYSLAPFAKIFAKKLDMPLDFVSSDNIEGLRRGMRRSKERLALVENLRFFKEEETNDSDFAETLSMMGDFYVNDAFAVSHRNNASVVAITKYLPSYAGLLMEKEIKNLDMAMKKPKRPFAIILGGAKMKDKILGLRALIRKADDVLLGSNAFNESVPKSPKLIWPEDGKRHGKFIWDIGPFTVNRYASIIGRAKTVIWNGPSGFFEKKGFEKGTIGIWKAVLSNKKAHIVIGGGETGASFKLLGKVKISKNVFISTGGGAMLEYLSGKKLPGIEALK